MEYGTYRRYASGLLDVNEYTARLPKKKRRSNYSFEDVTRKSVAESVLQTSQTIFNQLNVFSHPVRAIHILPCTLILTIN